MIGPPKWTPPKRAQAAEWYARQIVRFVVGPAIMAWELLADHAHNLAIFLGGLLVTTSLDVRQYVRSLLEQARTQQRSLEDMLREEVARDRASEPDEEVKP